MRSYLDALARYFEFSGRTSRSQYWLYQLVVVLLVVAVIAYEYHTTHRLPGRQHLSPMMMFVSLFHAIPGITVTVRRLHDTGRSGWWYLLLFVPFAGLLVLVWTCYGSDPDHNDYGAPRGRSGRRQPRPDPEPFYARALRPSAASRAGEDSVRLSGSSERFI